MLWSSCKAYAIQIHSATVAVSWYLLYRVYHTWVLYLNPSSSSHSWMIGHGLVLSCRRNPSCVTCSSEPAGAPNTRTWDDGKGKLVIFDQYFTSQVTRSKVCCWWTSSRVYRACCRPIVYPWSSLVCLHDSFHSHKSVLLQLLFRSTLLSRPNKVVSNVRPYVHVRTYRSMSDARWYAVWPDQRSRSRSRALGNPFIFKCYISSAIYYYYCYYYYYYIW